MGKDCDATYSFQTFPNRSKLRLMLNISVEDDLTMLLISGPCWVNCSGVESDCEVTVTQHKWSPTQHSIDLFDMPPGNYCVKLFEIDCEDCCVICTQTEELTASQNGMSILLHMPMMHFFVVGFLLIICLLLLVVVAFNKKKVTAPVKHMMPIDQNCKIDEITEPSVDAIKNPLIWHVLLIYSRDNPSFCKLIESFRRVIMRLENVEVHDYLEELQIQHSSRNIVEWLTNYLQSSNTKVIIVVSKGAVLQQQALLRNKRVFHSDPHRLDSVFSYALCYLHNDFILSRNYKRIFSVRFEDLVNENLTLNFITPLKCFILMKHLDQLLMELRGVPASFDASKNEFSAYNFSETQDLINTLEEIKK